MTETKKNTEILQDKFGRTVNYVRISVTDRCDFRCIYCMEEEMTFVPRAQLLTLEEIAVIARAFTALGVTKIRITGGEPLVRRNILKLFQDLGHLSGLEELVITTNGSQLSHMAGELKDAGVKRINVSLDSLYPDKFRKLTRVGDLTKVLSGIDAALSVGFDRVKINSVILKNRNDDEIIGLVRFAINKGIDISFIEEMPLGMMGSHNRAEAYISSDQIRDVLGTEFALVPTTENTGGPSRYYRMSGHDTRVGFISPHSHNFCDSCNRVRLTSEGRLLLCLGQEHSVDLRQVIRSHPGDIEPLKQAIRDSMEIKPKGHEFDLQAKPVIFRHMNVTGG